MKPLHPIAFITTPNCIVHLESEQLHIYQKNKTPQPKMLYEIPTQNLHQLYIIKGAHITKKTLLFLLKAKVSITFFNWDDRCLKPYFAPALSLPGAWQLQHYQVPSPFQSPYAKI